MYPPLVCWGAKPGLRGIKSGTYEASSPACDGHLHTRPILLILPQFSRAVRKFWLNLKMGRSRGGRQGRLPLAAAGSSDEFGNHRFGSRILRLHPPCPRCGHLPFRGRPGNDLIRHLRAAAFRYHNSVRALAARIAVLLGRAREGRSPLEFKSSPATCAVGVGNFSGGDSERVPSISKTYLH